MQAELDGILLHPAGSQPSHQSRIQNPPIKFVCFVLAHLLLPSPPSPPTKQNKTKKKRSGKITNMPRSWGCCDASSPSSHLSTCGPRASAGLIWDIGGVGGQSLHRTRIIRQKHMASFLTTLLSSWNVPEVKRATCGFLIPRGSQRSPTPS